MNINIKLLGLGLAITCSYSLGCNLAETPAQRLKLVRAHNAQVIQTTEAAAVNYSRVGSAQDLSPEGLIPMSQLDASYRDPGL